MDMALRPSGRSGPLAVNLPVFAKYYVENAWTWEFMALSRARVVAGSSSDFNQRVSGVVFEQLRSKDFGQNLAHDILDMHTRLARDKPALGFWDIKGKPGGLRDIEFIAQFFVLDHKLIDDDTSTISMLERAGSLKTITQQQIKTLIEITVRYQSLLQLLKLAAQGDYESNQFSSSFKTLLTKHSKFNSFKELEVQLQKDAANVGNLFSKIIG